MARLGHARCHFASQPRRSTTLYLGSTELYFYIGGKVLEKLVPACVRTHAPIGIATDSQPPPASQNMCEAFPVLSTPTTENGATKSNQCTRSLGTRGVWVVSFFFLACCLFCCGSHQSLSHVTCKQTRTIRFPSLPFFSPSIAKHMPFRVVWPKRTTRRQESSLFLICQLPGPSSSSSSLSLRGWSSSSP